MTRKRTRDIDLARMRKVATKPALKPLLAAIAGIGLIGCSSKDDVKIAYSIEDCADNTSLTEEQCEVAYRHALAEAERSAPKFIDLRDCETNFGFNNCIQDSNGWFMPALVGFVIAEAVDEVGDAIERQYYSPAYRNRNRDLVLSDGSSISYGGHGKYHIPKDANKPKASVKKPHPKGTKTLSRGGFGSTASAKSSWGGGKSSGGWGG